MKKDIDKSAGLPWGDLPEENTQKTHDLSKTYDIGNGVPGNQKVIYTIALGKTLY